MSGHTRLHYLATTPPLLLYRNKNHLVQLDIRRCNCKTKASSLLYKAQAAGVWSHWSCDESTLRWLTRPCPICTTARYTQNVKSELPYKTDFSTLDIDSGYLMHANSIQLYTIPSPPQPHVLLLIPVFFYQCEIFLTVTTWIYYNLSFIVDGVSEMFFFFLSLWMWRHHVKIPIKSSLAI